MVDSLPTLLDDDLDDGTGIVLPTQLHIPADPHRVTRGQSPSFLTQNYATFATAPVDIPRHYRQACGNPHWDAA
ncbi:unnamed protein product [Linum trigynum]|uniref:Uncharacterized protein n=1 Tax=Linum trigynum TaxID=586398 RepID=A0AAV2DS15_9ROSI